MNSVRRITSQSDQTGNNCFLTRASLLIMVTAQREIEKLMFAKASTSQFSSPRTQLSSFPYHNGVIKERPHKAIFLRNLRLPSFPYQKSVIRNNAQGTFNSFVFFRKPAQANSLRRAHNLSLLIHNSVVRKTSTGHFSQVISGVLQCWVSGCVLPLGHPSPLETENLKLPSFCEFLIWAS